MIGATVLGLGGIRTHLQLLCQVLRRAGVAVQVFATGSHWDSRSVANLQSLGVQFIMPPPLVRRSRKLSALHAALSWPLRTPRRANSLYCISPGASQLLLHRLRPRGTTSINHEIVEPPGPESPAGRCAASLDVSVANSRKVAQLMQDLWPAKPIRVIPFLTSDRPAPPPQRGREVGAGLLRVVYLGRLVSQKRPDELVRRWREICQRPGIGPARLDVYGYDPSGEMLAQLRELVMTSRLGDSVTIHGEYALPELGGILDQSDLVVLPSLWEGLPLVLVEAMLKGVPFVACAAGGTEELGDANPDVVITESDWSHFETGLEQMARRIRLGLVDPIRLHSWAEARYGFDSVSTKWLRCLREPQAYFDLP